MVQRDQRKGAEPPEDEGVGQAGQWPFANDLGLAENLPEEVPDALADGKEMEAGSFFEWRIFLRTTPKRRQKP